MTLVVVEVEERIDARLTRRAGIRYTAPPQPVADARLLVALLLGVESAPDGEGPWRRPLAGGQRVVRLSPADAGAG